MKEGIRKENTQTPLDHALAEVKEATAERKTCEQIAFQKGVRPEDNPSALQNFYAAQRTEKNAIAAAKKLGATDDQIKNSQ